MNFLKIFRKFSDFLAFSDQVMSNSTEMYAQKNWSILRGRNAYIGQKVPPNYVCKLCQKTGHFIYDCPQATRDKTSIEMKKTTGIPRSFLKPATADTPGAKINPQGKMKIKSRNLYNAAQ